MNPYFLVAAVLAFAIGLAHSWLGEQFFRAHPHLAGTNELANRTLHFAWHLTTVAWWGAGTLLSVLSKTALDPPRRALARVIATTFLASAIVALIGSRGRHPSWVGFLAIAVAVWFGAYRR